MNYSVSDVSVALDSVSQICDSGATVTFHKTGGYIERPSGARLEFRTIGDTYARFVSVADAGSMHRPQKKSQDAQEARKDAIEPRVARAQEALSNQKNEKTKWASRSGTDQAFAWPRLSTS